MGTAVHSTFMGLAAGLNCYGGVYVVTPAVDAPNEDYGINGYFESHIKGSQAGHVYGGGMWINVDAGFDNATDGSMIAAQDNGVYEAAASDFNDVKIIFGLRCEGILTNAPGSFYPFSINTSNRAITAIFDAAANPSIGFTAGTGTSGTQAGYVPLYAVNGTVRYVRVYETAT